MPEYQLLYLLWNKCIDFANFPWCNNARVFHQMFCQSKLIITIWASNYQTILLRSWYGNYPITSAPLKSFLEQQFVLDIPELLSLLALIQESYSMLNIISNSSAFVLKQFRLLYGRDKDSLSEVLMFVQSHAHTFLLSSTIFITSHALNVKLCRVCNEFLKSVEWIRYNVPIKSTYIIQAF